MNEKRPLERVFHKFEDYLIGQDPFRIEHHWNYLYRSMYFRGSILMSALSAVDIAMWDIKGKALNVPVYELIDDITERFPAKARSISAQVAFDGSVYDI